MGCDKSSCRINGGKCVGLARIQEVNKLRKDFWGAQHDEAIKTKEKGQRLQEIMRKFYNGHGNPGWSCNFIIDLYNSFMLTLTIP